MHTVETSQGPGIVHDSLEELLVSIRAVRRQEGSEHYLITPQKFEERPFNIWDILEECDKDSGYQTLQYAFAGDSRAIIIGALSRAGSRRSTSEDKTMAKIMLSDAQREPSSNRYVAVGQRIGRAAFRFALVG